MTDVGTGPPVALHDLGQILFNSPEGCGIWPPQPACGLPAGHHVLGLGTAAAFNEVGQIAWNDAAGFHVHDITAGTSTLLGTGTPGAINNPGEIAGNSWICSPGADYAGFALRCLHHQRCGPNNRHILSLGGPDLAARILAVRRLLFL